MVVGPGDSDRAQVGVPVVDDAEGVRAEPLEKHKSVLGISTLSQKRGKVYSLAPKPRQDIATPAAFLA
jgi:hypothetical protein